MTRVLAVVVTPPSYRASGGVAAGLELSRHVARITGVEIEAAIMADSDFVRDDGGLRLRGFRCRNRLGPLQSILPQALATTQWRSSIPAYIASTRPDIVHLHNPVPPGALWDVARACVELRIPYVISTHGFVEMTRFAEAYRLPAWVAAAVPWFIERPFRRVVTHADRVCMLSPLEGELLDSMNVSPDHRAVVTNGATLPQPVAEPVRARLRQRLGLRAGVPLWLFVGNHTANKGIDILLTAAGRVSAPMQVIVAGAIRSPESHAALRASHNLDQLGDRVVFTNFLSDEDLQALYQTVDAFVFPSRADTLPLVILDAMASGLPVVATPVGGIPYQVTADTGVLVPVDDSAALASAMDLLSMEPGRRRALGDGGRRRVREIFDWSRAAAAAAATYAHVVGQRT